MSTLAQLQPGVVFAGDFRVVRPLKEGGMGAVYVVEQLSTSKPRALKVMLPDLVAQPSLRKRFETEARVGARIRSDHVVEVIASGVDAASGMPWLVMELLEGEDLEAHARRRGPLPPGEVRAILEQLCHALGEAHREGIVHRDLKPENIFLAVPRRAGAALMVKVLDFGIARVAAEARATSSTTLAILGTPLWMSPEQAQPGVAVTPAADVWALGLIVYRLLTGRCFWRTAYAEAPSILMLMNEAFVMPLSSASGRAAEDGCAAVLPAGFDAWFERCTARDPGARFADATLAFEALDRVLAEGAAAVSVPASPAVSVPVSVEVAGAPPAGSDAAGRAVSVPVSVAVTVHEPAGLATAATQVVGGGAAVGPEMGASAPVVTHSVVVQPVVTLPAMGQPVEASAPVPISSATPGGAPRSRASVVVSVLVTVTVAFGAMGLVARSFLAVGSSADVTQFPGAVTASPSPSPMPVQSTLVAASAAPTDGPPAAPADAPSAVAAASSTATSVAGATAVSVASAAPSSSQAKPAASASARTSPLISSSPPATGTTPGPAPTATGQKPKLAIPKK